MLTEAINDLRVEIKQLSKPVKPTPVVSDGQPAPENPVVRPPLTTRVRYTPNTAAQYGSKEMSQNIVTSQKRLNGKDKFWLYLSRIRPDTTDNVISAIAKECLETTMDPEVVRLVPKGVDTSGLSFISFKVGLDPVLKNVALDPSTWPDGILFREFEEYGSSNFRQH